MNYTKTTDKAILDILNNARLILMDPGTTAEEKRVIMDGLRQTIDENAARNREAILLKLGQGKRA